MDRKIIKIETTQKKFRLFKNRFETYVLQEKPKSSPKSPWAIVNAFATKNSAKNFLQSITKNELKKELTSALSSN